MVIVEAKMAAKILWLRLDFLTVLWPWLVTSLHACFLVYKSSFLLLPGRSEFKRAELSGCDLTQPSPNYHLERLKTSS